MTRLTMHDVIADLSAQLAQKRHVMTYGGLMGILTQGEHDQLLDVRYSGKLQVYWTVGRNGTSTTYVLRVKDLPQIHVERTDLGWTLTETKYPRHKIEVVVSEL